MIKKVLGIYYSPAEGTADMTRRLAADIAAVLDECSPADVSMECHSFSEGKGLPINLDEETLVVVGMPSWVGKMPLEGIKALSRINASGNLTIAAVSYGSTSYGNALYELKHYAEDRGLKVVGAGAFSVKRPMLGIRRNVCRAMVDEDTMCEFVGAASEKIKRLCGCDVEELKIKPAPLEVRGRMPIHMVSRISPPAAAIAEALTERISIIKRKSEWYL